MVLLNIQRKSVVRKRPLVRHLCRHSPVLLGRMSGLMIIPYLYEYARRETFDAGSWPFSKKLPMHTTSWENRLVGKKVQVFQSGSVAVHSPSVILLSLLSITSFSKSHGTVTTSVQCLGKHTWGEIFSLKKKSVCAQKGWKWTPVSSILLHSSQKS